jgi:hypothetical protein
MYALWIEADGRFHFSPSDNGGVEITDEQHADLIHGQDSGSVISNDGKGNPILTERPSPTAEQLWADYQAKAQALLDKTDIVCLRCYKAGVAYPADWQKYTADLRAIVSAKSGDPTAALPPSPAYPAGT